MLFKDLSCVVENTLDNHYKNGIYNILGTEWAAIITITNKFKVYIDGKKDILGIGDEYALEFLNKYKKSIFSNYKPDIYNEENLFCMIIPIRKTETYSVFNLHCKRTDSYRYDEMKWLRAYSELNYQFVLSKNELIQDRNYIENILDSTEFAIITIDINENIVAANNTVKKLFTINENNFLGNYFLSYLNPKDKQEFILNMRKVMKTGIKKNLKEVVFIKGNSAFLLNISISPLYDSKDRLSGALIIGDDVTEQRLLENQLEQIKQNNVLGEISIGLAHDIKNPLMNIYSCVNYMNKYENFKSHQVEMLNIIKHEVKSINTVIEQMLSYYNVSKNKTNVININELLKNCIERTNRQKLGKFIQVKYNLDDNIPCIIGDYYKVQQVFMNIFINSIEAIERSGYIDVTSIYKTEDNSIYISVEDNGKGMMKECIDNIFKINYTNKKNGTGLGMAIVKRTLDEYNAKINVNSKINKGTIIKISIPVDFNCYRGSVSYSV